MPVTGNTPIPTHIAALPFHLTSLIGREREITALGDLLPTSRLLTLTGPGGVGKTRLALEVAARAATLTPEAWVDLAPLSDPALVPQAVATALGVREEAGRTGLKILTDRLRDRPLLLVLDNCEHLVDACAALAESLLRGCPEVRILATSREALGVSGEQAWLVPPLTLPDTRHSGLAETVRSESGRLFLERARAVLPTFAVDQSNAGAVAQICRRLDGIPLAIELAAARVRVLAPEQIAARLDESFRLLAAPGRPGISRHRTLREAIDWSHALLAEAEAALFRRLAVFAGSFSLDAVEAICPASPISAEDVLDLLSALVDKSLVGMEMAGDEARYRLLETLRQYARDKLAAAGEEGELRERHARFFVDLAVVAERPTFGGASDPAWTRRLIAEEGNLRAAADWAEESPDRADQALRLASAMHWHWFARGHFREGRHRVSAALAQADAAPRSSRAKALAAAATLAFWLGEHHAIAAPAAEAVRLLRDLDDPWSLAYALTTLGVASAQQDPQTADNLLTEAVAIARPHRGVLPVFSLYWQARVAFGRGEIERALGMFEECLGLAREVGSPPAIGHSLTMLGLVEVERDRFPAARGHLAEALRRHYEVGDVLGCVWTLEGLARLATREQQLERAARLLAAVRAERERIGAPWSDHERAGFDALTNDLRARLGGSVFAMTWDAGSALSLEGAVQLALHTAPGSEPATAAGELPAVVEASSTTDDAAGAPATAGRLEVRALGPLEIAVDGRPLERDAWNSARPRELLLFLLTRQEGFTREQVGVAFWPDASAEQVRNNFHVTLHRLRKTLGGAHWVTLRDDRYAIDPAAAVNMDARRFERDVPSARARLKARRDAAPLEAALALYRGDFLEQENAGDWHLELRDRLRRLYMDALGDLGGWWLGQERWREAADAFRRLIAGDELNEPAYRGLMTCHARLGERAEALRLYQRLAQLLKRELEVDPEPETDALYGRLRGSTPA